MFAKSGLTTEPCGVPLYVWCFIQSSRYPAWSSFQIRSMKASFFILRFKILTRMWWSMLSKHPLMSPSTNQLTPVKVFCIWRYDSFFQAENHGMCFERSVHRYFPKSCEQLLVPVCRPPPGHPAGATRFRFSLGCTAFWRGGADNCGPVTFESGTHFASGSHR